MQLFSRYIIRVIRVLIPGKTRSGMSKTQKGRIVVTGPRVVARVLYSAYALLVRTLRQVDQRFCTEGVGESGERALWLSTDSIT